MTHFSFPRSAAFKQAIALAACAVWLVACASSEDNAPEQQSENPRIVSLNPCVDAILFEVAERDQILALSHYSRDPSATTIGTARAREFGVTGGTVEEVAALSPDLVLAGSFIAPATRNALNDMGFALETVGIASSVEESIAQVTLMAATVGNPAAGEELNERIIAAIDNHSLDTSQTPISTVLWQPGQIVPGDATLVAELLQSAGFTSHNTALGLSQADYLPLEILVANPPDLILIAGDSKGQRHTLLEHLPETTIASFDPKLFYCGGPSIITAMERLAEIRAEIKGVGA